MVLCILNFMCHLRTAKFSTHMSRDICFYVFNRLVHCLDIREAQIKLNLRASWLLLSCLHLDLFCQLLFTTHGMIYLCIKG